ncbi:MAG: hypothetical protein O2899_03820, partial [Bacteroidetes bacterium]|nr:hypothetical protein [Bacteroidota bacterium]
MTKHHPAKSTRDLRAARVGFGLLVLLGWLVPAQAQRPIQTFDPFYQGESATRHFFDAYAVSAELTYRPPGLLQSEATAVSAVAGTAVGMHLRLDYRLADHLDLGFYVDASGNGAGRSMDLSWIALKYYRLEEGVDYALRFAIDPSSDGTNGFPQADLGFLYSTPLSALVTQDFGIGIRRVRIGFQELQSIDTPIDPGDPLPSTSGETTLQVRGRTEGWEMHFSWSHNILFDPAGSNLFVAFMAEGGKFNLLEWQVGEDTVADTDRAATRFTGGVVWIRSGLQ